MKKFLAVLFTLILSLSLVGCSMAEDAEVKGEGVMTYAEFVAAELETEVVIETYVQGKQSWWDNKGTFYTQDKDGAYFLYEMGCTEEEYNKLVEGIRAGEIVVSDSLEAPAVDANVTVNYID